MTGRNFSILNGYFLSTEKLIPGGRPNNYLLMHQWFIPREMRCYQYWTTMASQDMQSHMRDKSITNDHYITVLSTKWTYTSQLLVQPHFLCQGKYDLGFICPKWRRILCLQFMAKLLSCRLLYIWLQWRVVKLRVLSSPAIVKPLRTQWVYEGALSMAVGDTYLFEDNWL